MKNTSYIKLALLISFMVSISFVSEASQITRTMETGQPVIKNSKMEKCRAICGSDTSLEAIKKKLRPGMIKANSPEDIMNNYLRKMLGRYAIIDTTIV